MTVNGEEISALASESVFYPLAAGETLETSAELSESLVLPVEAGQEIGELSVRCGGTEIARIALISDRAVAAAEEKKQEQAKRQTLAERLWDLLSA